MSERTYDLILALDIETAPTTDETIIDRYRTTLEPPGTHKKPETIAAWWAEQAPKVLQERVAKTALDGMRGNVIAVGWCVARAYTDGTVEADDPIILVRQPEESVASFLATALGLVAADLTPTKANGHLAHAHVAGHNLVTFDLPFLWQQAVRYDVPWPSVLPVLPSPYDNRVLDTMTALVGARNTISLEDACLSLGVHFEDDTPSADVPIKWAAGDRDAVMKHLANDVVATLAIALRIKSVRTPEVPEW